MGATALLLAAVLVASLVCIVVAMIAVLTRDPDARRMWRRRLTRRIGRRWRW
jgi:hypothetical protein